MVSVAVTGACRAARPGHPPRQKPTKQVAPSTRFAAKQLSMSCGARENRRRAAAVCEAARNSSDFTRTKGYGVVNPIVTSATQVVLSFFDAFNRRDMKSLLSLYAHDCTHHDLAYSGPAVGIAETRRFVEEFTNGLPSDVQFIVDDITSGDASSVGGTWRSEELRCHSAKGLASTKSTTRARYRMCENVRSTLQRLPLRLPPCSA
mmetsp:Transcript_5805/g.10432  ORF Transcript_5805/g.10432 Transcript_5805/m.10432 type:complete len:205 (-) Transcript_5805:1872-2486(-)